MPRISVVIPTYNYADFIGEALDSVFGQSFTDYEVIVVDDGSTDNTRDVVAPYGARVQYYFQQNQGLAVARNVGLRLAIGDYITYLDADDIWERDNLRVKVEILRDDPELGGVFSDFAVFDANGVRHPRGTRYKFPFFKRTGRDFNDVFDQRGDVTLPDGRSVLVYRGRVFDSLFLGNFILPTSMVFSRTRALRVGDFLAELRTQEDYEYWLRFTKRYPVAFVEEVLVRYRRHPRQLTDHSQIEDIFLGVHRIIDEYEEEYTRLGRQREFARRKAGLLTDLAKVYIRQGRVSEARARLGESIRRDARYLQAYAGLAVTVVPHRWLSWVRGWR